MRAEPRFALLLLCFFLSGFAALIYQTAWTRQFAFVFGTSELAIATVLAAYMGGLAAGAAAMGRLVGLIRRPVLSYGLLELGIAASALAVPAALAGATRIYVGLFRAADPAGESLALAHGLFYLVASFAILLAPTGLMGATLPLLARHAVRRESEIGSRVGSLYSVNTAGAVAGTLVAAFALLPRVGLERTVWVAVAANALIFGAAALLARGAAAAPAAQPAAASGAAAGRWILPLVAVSGAVSFAYEVLWSRLIGQLLGGSVQGFATMLASFLIGIAAGSALASRAADRPERAARGFAWAQLGSGGLALLAFAALDRMPAFSDWVAGWSGVQLAADASIAAATLLPGALCIGATFPLAVRVLARHESQAARASAEVYAWNTLGAIAGAVGAGFFLLPALGFAGMLTLAVACNAALALATGLMLPRAPRRVAAGAALALLALAWLLPQTPWQLLRSSVFRRATGLDAIVHYGVGRSATVLLGRQNGGWRLLTNGLPEARMLPRGGSGGGALHQWLGAMAGLAHPEARRMLMIGLGGGSALAAVPSSFAAIDVVEIEPEVIRANRSIASLRGVDPLADPRVRLIVNDARGALLLARDPYDAIVSQPSHPWTVGASNLYTREFFELAREHLTPSGVLVQWMGLQFVDAELLRSLIASLVDVFPYVRVYRPVAGGLLLLASAEPLAPEQNAAQAVAAAPDEFAALGVYGAEDVAAALVLDEAGARELAAGAPRNTDGRNYLGMRGLDLLRDPKPASTLELLAPFDPLVGPTPGLDRAYLVRRLLARRMVPRARRVAEASGDPAERLAALGLVAAAADRSLRARRLLERALQLDPGSREARAGLLRLRRTTWLARDPQLAGGLEATEALVVEGWRHEAASDWSGVRSLDTGLAGIGPRDPLFSDALRLRISWRLAEPDATRADEALDLAGRLIPTSGASSDWLLHARATAAAGNAAAALASLMETGARLRAGPADQAIARDALALLASLEPELDGDWQRTGVEELLTRHTRRSGEVGLAEDPATW